MYSVYVYDNHVMFSLDMHFKTEQWNSPHQKL